MRPGPTPALDPALGTDRAALTTSVNDHRRHARVLGPERGHVARRVRVPLAARSIRSR